MLISPRRPIYVQIYTREYIHMCMYVRPLRKETLTSRSQLLHGCECQRPQALLKLELCADFIESAAARRAFLGRRHAAGRNKSAARPAQFSLMSHSCFKCFQSRTYVMKVFVFDNYFSRLSGR